MLRKAIEIPTSTATSSRASENPTVHKNKEEPVERRHLIEAFMDRKKKRRYHYSQIEVVKFSNLLVRSKRD